MLKTIQARNMKLGQVINQNDWKMLSVQSFLSVNFEPHFRGKMLKKYKKLG